MTRPPDRSVSEAETRWDAALAIGVIGFALLGQYLLTHAKRFLADGLVLYGVALVLFAGLLWQRRRDLSPETAGSDPARDDAFDLLRKEPIRLMLAAGGAGVAFTNVRLLQSKPGPGSYWDAFGLWLLSSLLVIAAFARPRIGSRPLDRLGSIGREHRSELLLVLGLTVGAGLLRLVALGTLPSVVNGDEGRVGALALAAMRGDITNMFATTFGHGTLYLFLMSVPYHLAGVSPFTLRLVNALAGTLAVPTTYLLVRRMFDRRAAFIASALLAVSHFHIHFSRVAMSGGVMDALLAALAVYFFYEGLKNNRPLPFALSGFTVGVHLYIYMGSRLVPLFLLAAGLANLVVHFRQARIHLANLLVFVFALAVVGAPMLLWMNQHPGEFMARVNQVGIFQTGWLANEARTTGKTVLAILFRQFGRSLLSLNYYQATAFYNSALPMLESFSAVAFVLGLAYGLVRFFETRFLLLNAWFWSSIVAGQALLVAPQEGSYRILIALPAIMAFAGVGWSRLVELGFRSSRPVGKSLALVLTLGLVALSAAGNIRYYFFDFSRKCVYTDTSTRLASALGKHLATLDRDYKAYLYGAPMILYGIHPSVDFLSRGLPVVNVGEAQGESVTFVDPTRKPIFYFVPVRLRQASLVEKAYPHGRWMDIKDCGQTVFRVYQVTELR